MSTRRLAHTLAYLVMAAAVFGQMVLTTSFADNNACDANFFDLEATGGANCLVSMLDINTSASGMVEVWVRPGTFAGFESSMAGWTMVTQVPVVSAGRGMPTPVPITSPFFVNAGTRTGIYVTTAGPGGGSQLAYINGVGTAGVTVQTSDAFLTVYEGAGECAYFGGGPNRPRNFSGNIYYNPGCTGECTNPALITPTISGLAGFRSSDDTVMVDSSVCMLDEVTPSCGVGGEDTFTRFTAPFDGTAIADTCGVGTTFDTILVAMDGACGMLNEITCNDNDPGACGIGTESLVSFNITAGTDYYLLLDGVGGATGTAELRLQLTEVPTGYVPCVGVDPNSTMVAAPRPVAIERLQLSSAGTGGSQVAWQPCYDQYYAFEISGAGLYEVFDAAGVQISSSASVGLVGRAIGFNPLTGTVDLLTVNAQTGGGMNDGLFQVGLDFPAFYTGMNTQLAAAIPALAGDDTAPALDYQRGLLYSREGSDTVNVIDAAGMLVGTIVLDSVAAGSPAMIPNGIAFSGIFGLELLVGTGDSVVVFDLTGAFVATVPLGASVAPGNWAGSYTNDLYWTWDGNIMQWRGFEIFDSNFSLACSTAAGGDLVLAAGAHTIDTDTGDIDGVLSPAFDGAAFNFDNVDIMTGAVVAVTGSIGLVIHATGDINVDGTIDAAGQVGVSSTACNSPGGAGGPGGPGGGAGGEGGGNQRTDGLPGAGPGGGLPGTVDSSAGGGGGFAMAGTSGAGPGGGAGGSPYAFLLPVVFGGSGGGGASADDDPPAGSVDPGDDGGGGGGGGGGAVVLNAAGNLTVGGTIDVTGGMGGGTGCAGNSGDGGGGSGGYVALLSNSGMPTVTGTIDLAGAGPGGSTILGGTGSDGRLLIETSPCGFTCTIVGPAAPPTSSLVTVAVDVLTMAPTYDASFDFSVDGGVTWNACTAALGPMGAPPVVPNPATGLTPGVMTPFRWDAAQDGIPYPSAGVLVRANVTDGMSMGVCTTAPFDIGCECGDCNLMGDGVTITDALVGAQLAAGVIVPVGPEQTLCCDVDGSAMVTVLDALQMAQAAAGLPFTPQCP